MFVRSIARVNRHALGGIPLSHRDTLFVPQEHINIGFRFVGPDMVFDAARQFFNIGSIDEVPKPLKPFGFARRLVLAESFNTRSSYHLYFVLKEYF